MRMLCLLSAAACLASHSAQAAMLRPFTLITAPAIRLADLFDALGATPDRVLGQAPAPGQRIVVNAPQLAAIARDFDVEWRPASGSERAVIERRGDVLPSASINDVLRRSLTQAGAPADCDIAAPDLQPIVLPAGVTVAPQVSQLNYDAPSGHFTALLSVSAPDMPGVEMRVSGQVVAMTRTVVASQRLMPGTVVGSGDVQLARVRLALLHGGAAMMPDAAYGLSVRHTLSAGQALGAADLMRPPLVLRGGVVRMTLDSDGISLTAQGIAAQAGARGDRIRVENPASHLMVDAEVTGQGEVRVMPRAATIALVSAQ